MKSEIENYRKYNISDFIVNTKKFKDYLEYCKKNNLIVKKKELMENLVQTLQSKDNCQNTNSVSELTNLCVFAIIFSDFEVELFFEIEHFNPELQRMILFQTINYCYDRQKDMQNYISNKFQFWILKMQNHSYISFKDNKDFLVEVEVKETIESLKKCLNQSLFDHSEDNVKILFLKIAYELAIYYYHNNNYEEALKYIEFLYKNISQNNSEDFKYLYFDLNTINHLKSYFNSKKNNATKEENKMVFEEFEEKNSDYEIELVDNSVTNLMDEDFNNYKLIIEKSKIKIKNLINNEGQISNDNNIFFNQGCLSLLKYIKISDYLINITLDNISFYNDTSNFIKNLKTSIDIRISKNSYKKEETILFYVKKELSFYSLLLQIIDCMKKNEDQLPKLFFKSLSDLIINNTLTNNLVLCGTLHTLMINFELQFKTIYSYLNDFVEFFNSQNTNNKKEIINQIVFLARIISIFNAIIDSQKKLNLPTDKEIIVNIDKELHENLINIFLFWLGIKKSGCELVYPPSTNIIYIFINSLKIVGYLKMYKIIVLGVLEFLLDKKHSKNLNSDKTNINNYLYQKNPKLFEISNFSREVLKQNKKIINANLFYYNIKVNFIEDKGKEKFEFQENEINFYIKKLFSIIELIEKKISKYETVNFISNNENDSNIKNLQLYDSAKLSLTTKLSSKKNFLFDFYRFIEFENVINKKEKKIIILHGINYLTLSLNEIKNDFVKIDMFISLTDVNKMYDNFKLNLNQDILYQVIFCLIKEDMFLESAILIQYSKKLGNNLGCKLLKTAYDKKNFNLDNIKYIWNVTYFEYIADIFNKNKDQQGLIKIKNLIKRISNHQFFKEYPLRKYIKIITFFNFLDYIKYNIQSNK